MSKQPEANLGLSRYDYAAEYIRSFAHNSHHTLTVFDIGAGSCRMREPVETSRMRWYGFDLAPSSDQVIGWDLSFPCPLSDVRADVVLLLDVIEHLLNPGFALQNIRDTLAPRGQILLTMPNPRWSRSRTHHLLFGDLANFTQSDLDWNHHVFTPWPHVLTKMLNDVGLEIEKYVTLDGKTKWPAPALSMSYLPLCVEAFGRKVIERYDRSACGMSFALTARLRY